ncbi:hypothetical protein LJ725_22140 [Reyranella aquatilis]|uniref:Uncharacterized protein n=1 Tax=Reyranella aquatilis TaxID=2035356 RepID=A0ABS8L059_9HYPH|nr:hypothetical protein [Reyranella aquatilis]MCC8431685.1 hypothetical protein [Reyranella aquatilis]
MEFLSGRVQKNVPRSRETMVKNLRGNHVPAFKAKVALAAIPAEVTLAQLAENFDRHLYEMKT